MTGIRGQMVELELLSLSLCFLFVNFRQTNGFSVFNRTLLVLHCVF